jgi:signal peptidase I
VKRPRLRSILSTAAFLIVVATAWWFFAPTQVGGSTRYVVTGGVSMEPRFHTGDLALVRPTSEYKVGDITAYWSTLLHKVVLHRIHAIDGNTYVFKGDNNNFLDPTHPTRAQLLGKLWLHVPGAGVWLNALHNPVVAFVICALLATGLLFPFREERRRRKRRRKSAPRSRREGLPLVNTSTDQRVGHRIHFGAFLTASAIAAAVFAVLGLVAFTRPAGRSTAATTPYTQQVRFGYSANAPTGPVYPTGAIRTGDPIFMTLVHELGVHVDYRFASAASHDVVGTEAILLELTSQTGWTRNLVLTPPTRFTGDHTSTVVTLDIPRIQSLLGKVTSLTGMAGASYTIAVSSRLHITGTVAGHPLNLRFAPVMNFELGGQQLIPQGATVGSSVTGSTGGGASSAGLTATRAGGVGTAGMAPATITVLGVSPKVSVLRWISVLGLLLSALAGAFLYLRKRSEPFEESVRIQAQHGHLIVPIIAGEDLGWPPVDVPNIKALVRLAESGQRLILHNRSGDVDTYMVNDEGTVYRYQVRSSRVVWGEWTDAPVPVDHPTAAAEAA